MQIFALIFGLFMFVSYSEARDVFEPIFQDRLNNLSWSKTLNSRYSNGCQDAYGNYDRDECTYEVGADGAYYVKIVDSKAATACQSIGARLPTRAELESLLMNFDHVRSDDGPQLTAIGLEQMNVTFGDNGNMFWTSSIQWKANAYVFNGVRGKIETLWRYYNAGAVRCVQP